ncbi:vitamin-D-receptor interacting mediator subunit 4-domain-containing protein [Polychytrium aggregatum]|uniref:vitamin-D-receptor interacting mediator subunit 4-domain-containing protein n=1 Tax=Polychytrium aggregatum TaxID=110093 RepID=UPI0022FE068C|nr:vitamin-D-receptor interacting mediator subunit 4-domain-containing protein [Polychytrium aggregatum]KAI9204221.1 vitamin-D-receptor interacting mediator subunit 4-domain-containing protein [Polychytrium aggregatum]
MSADQPLADQAWESISPRIKANSYFPEYTRLIRQLFESLQTLQQSKATGALVQGSDPAAEAKRLIAKIIDLDRKIQKFADELEQHQSNQRKIDDLQARIKQHTHGILNLVQSLRKAEASIELTLSQSRERIESLKQSQTNNVDYRDVIAYARRVAPYTAAPHKFNPQNPDPTIPFSAPVPQETLIRASLLFPKNLEAYLAETMAVTQHQREEIQHEVDAMETDILDHIRTREQVTQGDSSEVQAADVDVLDLDL